MIVKRPVLRALLNERGRDFVSILIGPRQVGKTFLLREIEKSLARQDTKSFFDLENPDHLRLFAAEDADVLRMLRKAGHTVFIDEFHYIKNATKIFKALVDSGKSPKIYASGSSSIEIHRHLAESLAGRYRETTVFPFDYAEEFATVPGMSVDEYFIRGGLPGVVHEKEPAGVMALLANVLSTYLMKDIKGLIKEENVRAFNALLYHLAQNQGGVLSTASIAREIRLSEPTTANHLELLGHTYVCWPVHSYSTNLGNELKKSRKYYLYDLGIRNAILKDFSSVHSRPDRGAMFESFVFLAMNRTLAPNQEIRFWRTRTGDEVDFILLTDRAPLPIEVKAEWRSGDCPPGMARFFSAYPKIRRGIVCAYAGEYGTAVYSGRTVETLPLIHAGRLAAAERG